MENFIYQNPVAVVFGQGQIAALSSLLPPKAKIMMTYGGGSIFKNGVYDQVKQALEGFEVVEFGGIEPNPQYSTVMKAMEIVKKEKVTFLLSVGGGSVLDGTKFLAAAACYEGTDPWDMLEFGAPVKNTLPLACVITLPATGSETNGYAVVSRAEKQQKLVLYSPLLFPKFAVIDPSTTFSLPARQTANGIVDTFVHVMEQYMTHPANTPLQDRQSEAILSTLLEEAPKVMADPNNYEVRANLFWAATQALNGWLCVGTPQCWATHFIGHELTAQTGTDHARTLALVLPALWKHQRKEKGDKLIQFGQRVFGIVGNDREKMIDETIAATKKFFESVGIKASREEYGVTEDVCQAVAQIVDERGAKFGDRENIGGKEILEILQLCDA